MRIKYSVKCSGLKVTAPNKNDPAIKHLFKVVCPAIDEEYRAKQSAMQNTLADNGAGCRRKVDSSKDKSWLSIGAKGDFGVVITQEAAVAVLRKFNEMGVLLDDKTIELNAWKTKPEAQAALKAAIDAGATHFRQPVARIGVTLFVRPEEEEFVFNCIEEEIRDKIKILREMPLEIVPLYNCANNLRALMQDTETYCESPKSSAIFPQLDKVGSVLDQAVGLLDTLDLRTGDARSFRGQLAHALGRARQGIENIRSFGNWRWIKTGYKTLLDDVVDIVKNSGLDEYELRVTGGNSAFDPNPRKTAEEEVEMTLDI
ncbi:MAG: hypothetical protein J6S75_01930 [Thermoguttaceae bacterium]|nr:hypothetical protein [Thermoguttaceae bacterium]